MVLDKVKLLKYLEQPYNKELLELARKRAATMTMYVTGEGLVEHIESLPYFEKDELTKLRRRLTRSTVDLFDRLLAPVEKVFTARGGFESYGLDNAKEHEFKNYLSNIVNGLSLKEWVQHVPFMAKLVDPMSVTMLEIDESGKVYPTYKSSAAIYDYQLKGRYLEYIIFTLSNNDVSMLIEKGVIQKEDGQKVYRVIDDENEYIITNVKGIFNTKQVIANHFGYVPAIINGDKLTFNSDYIGSELEAVMELAADFFNDNSSKSLFKKYQMHAKEWSIDVTCGECKGEGTIKGDDCVHCSGTGREPTVKVSQTLSIGIGEDGNMKMPTPPMGYVVPPIDSWKMVNEELDRLKKDIYDTFYDNQVGLQTAGINFTQNTAGEQRTATEVIINEKHKEPTLRKFSKWAQELHKFVAEGCKVILYGSSDGCSVTYGDKYMLIDYNELITQYQLLRRDNAPIGVMDDALIEVYENKYATNPLQLRKALLLMKVEPFVHYNLSEIIQMNINPKLKDMKLYFGEWTTTMDDIDIISSTEEQLRGKLEEYVIQKQSQFPQDLSMPLANNVPLQKKQPQVTNNQ